MTRPNLLSVFDSVLREMKNQELAAATNFYSDPFTLVNLFEAIDNFVQLENGELEKEDCEVTHYNNMKTLKNNLVIIHQNNKEWQRLHATLYLWASSLEVQAAIEYDKLTALKILLKEPEIIELLTIKKQELKKGYLLDCTEIFPDGYFKANENGIFMRSGSANIIRKAFGYYSDRIKNLEDIGFIYSEDETCFNSIKDVKTGVITNIRGGKRANIKGKRTGKKKTRGFNNIPIKYNAIIGINREYHQNKIKEFNEAYEIRVREAHKIKHKEYRNINVYVDENGNQTTAKDYAILCGISKQAAYKRLNKLNKERIKC